MFLVFSNKGNANQNNSEISSYQSADKYPQRNWQQTLHRCEESATHITAGRLQSHLATIEIIMAVLKKLKINLPYGPYVPRVGICPKDSMAHSIDPAQPYSLLLYT